MRILLNPKLDKEHFNTAQSYWDLIHKKYEGTSNKFIPRRTVIDGINIQILPYIDVGVKLITFDINTKYGMRKITYDGENSFVTFSYRLESFEISKDGWTTLGVEIPCAELRLINLNKNNFVFFINGDLVTPNDEECSTFKEHLNIDLPENYFEWSNEHLTMIRMCV